MTNQYHLAKLQVKTILHKDTVDHCAAVSKLTKSKVASAIDKSDPSVHALRKRQIAYDSEESESSGTESAMR